MITRARCRGLGLAVVIGAASSVVAQDAVPLSAIDWLSRSVDETRTTSRPIPAVRAPIEEPPVSDGATTPEVTMRPLDAQSLDAIGLLGGDVTGLPRNLWAGTDADLLALLIAAQDAESLPAMQGLMRSLLLAEVDAPVGEGDRLFLARVDKLLDIGALDAAEAMLARADPRNPEVFRRQFDLALLVGQEDAACDRLAAAPDVAPSLLARIFCLARSGDWPAAALTLSTARALGDVNDAEDALMSRFLDPELYEGDTPLTIPDPMTPLEFRMFEAIGEPQSTPQLPRAFAHADLRATAGWRARLNAAERLARTGAISSNAFLGIYTEREPAASGTVWDRVAAVQALETAIEAEDPGAIDAALPAAWDAAKAVHGEVLFVDLFGGAIAPFDLSGEAARVRRRMGLLSEDYELIARTNDGFGREAMFLAALAQGQPSQAEPHDEVAAAISAGFEPGIETPLIAMAEEGRLGEAILRAMSQFNAGAKGDPNEMSEAIALFRKVGLEDTARRAALQALLLERLK